MEFEREFSRISNEEADFDEPIQHSED